MKHTAIRLANEYRATSNALCFGGVQTELNNEVMNDKELWNKIMDVTPLKRWASAQQAAEWIYFLTVVKLILLYLFPEILMFIFLSDFSR